MFGIFTHRNSSSTQNPVEPSTSSRVEQVVNLLGVSIIFVFSASINFAIAPDPLSALLGTVVLTGLSCSILRALRRVEWSHFFSYSFDVPSSSSTHVIHHHTSSSTPPQSAVLITDPPTSNWFVPHVPPSHQGRGQPTSHVGSVAGGIRAQKKEPSSVSGHWSSPGWFDSQVYTSHQGRGQPTSHVGSVAGGIRAQKKETPSVSDHWSSDDDQLRLGVGITGSRAMKK